MMFEAWVLVCVMGNQCFPAQDTRGPYATHEQCYERTIEMGSDILQGVPGHMPVDWKCIPLGTAT
jgi:hypothetical protein|tara:strand:+ start:1363 stop:1557 length:195 start_codon:yes stop_codon:yes gene_type:complete